MITAHASSGIDSLHAALTTADTQLSRLAARVQTEFSLHNPQSSANPYHLLHRLRLLQNDIPALVDTLQKLDTQKHDLITDCRTTLQQNTAFARHVLPVAAPRDDTLVDGLKNATDAVAVLLSAFPHVSVPEPHVLGEALVREVVQEQGGVEVPKARGERSETVKSVGGKALGKKQGKKTVVVKSPRSEFAPISKTVYNRLPRNLKIKAGKLPQINDFYQKVFSVLSDANDAMTDAEIRKATGENDMTKFEVLRGLAVLRHGREGWLLA